MYYLYWWGEKSNFVGFTARKPPKFQFQLTRMISHFKSFLFALPCVLNQSFYLEIIFERKCRFLSIFFLCYIWLHFIMHLHAREFQNKSRKWEGKNCVLAFYSHFRLKTYSCRFSYAKLLYLFYYEWCTCISIMIWIRGNNCCICFNRKSFKLCLIMAIKRQSTFTFFSYYSFLVNFVMAL